MKKRNQIFFLSILLSYNAVYGQNKNFPDQERKISEGLIDFRQIKTDSIFSSHQIISLLTLQKNSFDRFSIEFGYSISDLRTTSFFGKSKNAVAAINGSFFDVDSGGSVTYFELNDSIISRTRSSGLKWVKPDSLINGAIVITHDLKIRIQPANSDQFYELSK